MNNDEPRRKTVVYNKKDRKIVRFPKFELAENPTINIKELKQRMKDRTLGDLKITDTVTGRVTTLNGSLDIINDVLNKAKASKKQRKSFWKNIRNAKR